MNETLSIAGFYASYLSGNANLKLPYGLSADQYQFISLGIKSVKLESMASLLRRRPESYYPRHASLRCKWIINHTRTAPVKAVGGVLGVLAAYAAIAALLYISGMVIGFLPSPWTCLTVSREAISVPGGTTFEMIHTNCDLIAKWERVVVYGRKRGDIRKTRIFEYAPAYDVPLPSIAVGSDMNIVVNLVSADDILFELAEYGRQISYRIGKIYYPDPTLDAFPAAVEAAGGATR